MKATYLNVRAGKGFFTKLKEMADTEGKQFLDMRLSMCDLDDFATDFRGALLPKWVHVANSHPTVFVFDDYDRATVGVKAIVDKLVDTNTLGEGEGMFTSVFNDNVEVYILNCVKTEDDSRNVM